MSAFHPKQTLVCAGGREGLTLDASRAVNVAFITSEAVTNALKHAFPDSRPGTISVSCRRHGGGGLLEVSDSGIGKL